MADTHCVPHPVPAGPCQRHGRTHLARRRRCFRPSVVGLAPLASLVAPSERPENRARQGAEAHPDTISAGLPRAQGAEAHPYTISVGLPRARQGAEAFPDTINLGWPRAAWCARSPRAMPRCHALHPCSDILRRLQWASGTMPSSRCQSRLITTMFASEALATRRGARCWRHTVSPPHNGMAETALATHIAPGCCNVRILAEIPRRHAMGAQRLPWI